MSQQPSTSSTAYKRFVDAFKLDVPMSSSRNTMTSVFCTELRAALVKGGSLHTAVYNAARATGNAALLHRIDQLQKARPRMPLTDLLYNTGMFPTNMIRIIALSQDNVESLKNDLASLARHYEGEARYNKRLLRSQLKTWAVVATAAAAVAATKHVRSSAEVDASDDAEQNTEDFDFQSTIY